MHTSSDTVVPEGSLSCQAKTMGGAEAQGQSNRLGSQRPGRRGGERPPPESENLDSRCQSEQTRLASKGQGHVFSLRH